MIIPFRRLLFLAVRTVGIAVVLFVIGLFFYQDHLVWHPTPYARGQVEYFPRPLAALDFHTGQGNQTAFYAPPRDHRNPPASLWVLFAGNGSLALDWGDVAAGDKDPGRGFLFIDYPGYGRCQGHPSPGSIRENTAGALGTLARRLGHPDASALLRSLDANGGRLGVAGHSIGTGAALEFASLHPTVGRVVLVSPFTSLRDLARTVVGWPLCWVLRGNFDNRARLAELAARAVPPSVLILHGDQDTLVPPKMGRALAASQPACARFELVAGADHNDVLDLARLRLLSALDE